MAKRIAGRNGKAFLLNNKKKIDLTPSYTSVLSCTKVTSGFSASPSQNQVILSWSDVGAVSYDVRYRISNGSWIVIPVSGTNVTITGLNSSTTYEWQVQAICSTSVAPLSDTQVFTTTAPSTSSITAGFYRNAKLSDYFSPDNFDMGHITESDWAANTNFKSAKLFCDSAAKPIFEKVTLNNGISGNRDWIRWRSKSTNCASGPWLSRSQLYHDPCECSTINQFITPTNEVFFDFTYYFPNTTNEDSPEPDWVSNTGGKLSPGVTGISGVGNTGGNPQTTGKHEGILHWYGLLNSKKDRRNSVHASTTFSITKFEIGWSVYEADTRTAGNKYQHDYFFCTAAGLTRKVFDVGTEYRFRGFTRNNTPTVLDGIYFFQVSENGGAWEDVLNVSDAFQQGNFTTPYGQGGLILFRGGDSASWLVGNNSSYPTTVHDTFILVKHYFVGTFLGMTNANTLNPVQDGNMFSFLPNDTLNGKTIFNVKWDIKNAVTGATLYSGNGAPDTVSKTGNFWHGRWNWPVINLDPAFAATSGGDVQVCKTITTTDGLVSSPYCLVYQKGVYDDNTTPVLCATPTNLASVPTTNSVTLTWNGSGLSYEISYREQGTSLFNTATTLNKTITLNNLVSGKNYEWKVKSICSNTTSETAINVFTTTTTQSCATPTGLGVTNISSTSATLCCWSNTSTTYEIRYRQTGATIWNQLVTSSLSASLTGLTPSTQYEAQIRSLCTSQQSAYSGSVTFTTLSGNTTNVTGDVLFVTNPTASAGDQKLIDLLEARGLTVTTTSSLTVAQAEQAQLVVFGPSSTNHNNILEWAKVNMVFVNNTDTISMDVATSNSSTSGNSINITDNTHPVTSQFNLGTLVVTNNNQTLSLHNGISAGATQLANLNNNVAVSVTESTGGKGEWWSFGRIAVLPFSEGAVVNLNQNGQDLFINACLWVLENDLSLHPNIPPYGFVSYDLDNGLHKLIASKSLDHPNTTYLFEIESSGNIVDYVFSPTNTIEYQSNTTVNGSVRHLYNNADFKVLIIDSVSGFDHSHGDEALTLFNTLTSELNLSTNTVFSVTKNNSELDNLMNYDVLVLASTTGLTHFTATQKALIEQFVNSGKSVIAFHAASDAFYHSSVDTGSSVASNIIGIAKDFDLFIIHADGDTQDHDEIAQLPVSALLLNAANLQYKSHLFFNNNLNEGDTAWQVAAMRENADFAKSLGLQIYDYSLDPTGSAFGQNAFSNVRAQLVALLSSGKKVLSYEAGPMEAIYRALNDTPVQYHPNITLISHSTWNENRNVLNAPGAVAARKWTDCKNDFPLVTYIDIDDQNANYKSNDWTWLDTVTYPVLKEARAKMMLAGQKIPEKVNDPSDAGMIAYSLFDSESFSVMDTKLFLEANLPIYRDKFTEVSSGILTFQAADFDLTGTSWQIQNTYTNYKGTKGYLNYAGANKYQAVDVTQTVETTFNITVPGTYQLLVRSYPGHPTDPSQQNDHWVNFPDADLFYAYKNGSVMYAKGNPYGLTPTTVVNDSNAGYFKYYNNVVAGWGIQTSAVDNNKHELRIDFNSVGTYTFQLSPRSNNFAADMFILKLVSIPEANVLPFITPGTTTTVTAKDPSNGVWDFYAENIVGASIQRNPNHTANNTSGTLSLVSPTTYDARFLQLGLPSSWSHNEEYFYWGPNSANWTGFLSPSFTELVRVGSTGTNAYDIPRMMMQFRDNGTGLMFYTALGHNSSTWTDTEFVQSIRNALALCYIKSRFSNKLNKQDDPLTNNVPTNDSGIGTTYYVSASGSGSGLSSSTPMSFSSAKAIWNASNNNNTYLFKRGDTFYDVDFTVTKDGASGSMTFGAYGTGTKPKFVGSPSATYASETWVLTTGVAGNNLWQLIFPGSSDVKALLRHDGKGNKHFVTPIRSNYEYANSGSASQLIDTDFPTKYPLTNAELTSFPNLGKVHWKADLYTWEWDTVNSPYAGNGTFNFVSGSHTTSPSTQYPYYIQGLLNLFVEGDQTIPYAGYSDIFSSYLMRTLGNNPNDYDYTLISKNTGLAISGSNLRFFNLDFDGWYQEAVYIDGSSRTGLEFTNCVFQNIFGAGIYNEFNGQFTLFNCLFHNIKGVGIYINSGQANEIGYSTFNEIGLDGGQILGVRTTPGRATNQFHSGITGFGKTTGGMENLYVHNNNVFNIGYNGIRFDGAFNTIDRNYIVSTMLELSDGGGIYAFGGNSTAYTHDCSITNNTIVYTPGNLNATPKNPDRNLAEGIYLDNGCIDTTVSNNTMLFAGGWAALNNFDNENCTWDDNTFGFSRRFGLLSFDQTTSGNNDDHTVTFNKFITWHPEHSPVIALKRNTPPGYTPVTTSDDNIFITMYNQRPKHENAGAVGTTYTEWVAYSTRYKKNLAQWQTASSLDASSDEILLDKDFYSEMQTRNDIYWNINKTSSSKQITLDGNWIDPTGGSVSFPYTILSGETVVFVKI